MKEISLDERKKLSIEILDVIDNFCKTNVIRYYLHAGTLLGAVRHNGFIPWDDDIDISMPRPDYEKFLSLFKYDNLFISNYRNNKRRTQPFSKVCSQETYGVNLIGKKLPYGIGVDVFPIDGFPKSQTECDNFFKKQDRLFTNFYCVCSGIENFGIQSKNPLKKVLKLLFSFFFSTSFAAKKVDLNAKKNAFESSEFAGCSVGLFRRKIEKARKSSFDSAVKLQFENKIYPCPRGYDDVLKSIYGSDYMTPPPEDKRKSTHTEFYYWK